ncbi:MAG: hypothetical protein WCT29_01560 [Candidatus Paceibacterota bacterium]|jgi:hypothetical protein
MSKPFLEDMIKRKNLDRKVSVKVPPVQRQSEPARVFAEPVHKASPSQNRSRYMLWTVAIFSITFLLIAISFLMEKAHVLVYPKIEKVTLDEDFRATKTLETGALLFDLVVISGEEDQKLSATEEKELSQKASGTAVIFNSFSSAPQRLDIDTRLSGSNGKIYKTRKVVTVPGMKTGGAPGSVEVEIYASEAGEEYNSGPIDFQIIGFKGTPKYDKFKVLSKPGTSITGGFVGTTLVASEAEKQSALTELEKTLKDKLYKQALGQIPPGFILWPNAVAFTVDNMDSPLGTEELSIKLNGTLYGLLFNEAELTKKIADAKVSGYEDADIYMPDIRKLTFTLAPVGDVSLEEMNTISFHLSGESRIVWRLDENKFMDEILGQPKKDFVSILSQHENIDRAELNLSPIWQRTIPDKSEKIKIEVNYPLED